MLNEAVAVAVTTGIFSVVLAVVNNRHAEKLKTLEGEDVSLPKLKHHSVFPKIHMLRNRVVLELEMESEGRKLIAKDVLTHVLQFCEEEYTALAKDHDERLVSCTQDCDSCQWVYRRHVQALDAVLQKCSDYYLKGGYTPEEQSILALVWTRFTRYLQPHVEELLATAERTVNSKFYKDCPVQSSIILDHVNAILGFIVPDAEETFREINGELTGRGPFRGVIVDHEKLSGTKGA